MYSGDDFISHGYVAYRRLLDEKKTGVSRFFVSRAPGIHETYPHITNYPGGEATQLRLHPETYDPEQQLCSIH